MPDLNPSNIASLKREDVEEEVQRFFEEGALFYSHVQKFGENEITERGVRIVFYKNKPGGHTAYNPLASDFNVPVPTQTADMFLYPCYYAMPEIQNEATRWMMQKTQSLNLQTLSDIEKLTVLAVTQRINRMYMGDGSGALAFSSVALGSTGSGQTLTCTTTAAATAGQTKGAVFLEEGHTYHAWNVAGNAPRGTIVVEATGLSSCTVNVTAGTVNSGDPIVDPNTYGKWHRGLAHLISGTNRYIQGVNSANYRDMNATEMDLAGAAPITPATIHQIKGQLNTRSNDLDASSGLTAVMTDGQYRQLAAQNYGFRSYIANMDDNAQTTFGVATKYKDADTAFIIDPYADDDRAYFFKNGVIKRYEQEAFGLKNLDGQEWRMLLGANSSGSGRYQRAWGCSNNLGIMKGRGAAVIKRAALAGVVTQVSA